MAVEQSLKHRLTARRRTDDTTSLNKFGWPSQNSESVHHNGVPCYLTNLDATTSLSVEAEIAVYEHIVYTAPETDLLPGDELEIVGVDGSTSVLPPHSRTVVKGVVNQFQRHYEYACQSYRSIERAL